jgi:Ca2+-binding RTX toxin-like protein
VSSLGRVLIAAAAFLAAAVPTASAAPTCAEGPQIAEKTIVGTPCDDTIRARGDTEVVIADAGDDVILAAPIATAAPPPEGEYLGIGSQTFDGGPGDDTVFGGRGNDRLNGGAGNDRLFGGPGDDTLRGGEDDDRLAGGFGFDSLDGEIGDDALRGDATIDKLLADSGGPDETDTLSYATGITPGFPDSQGPSDLDDYEAAGFPAGPAGRGVYIDLADGYASNGVAPDGGGVDTDIGTDDFEVIVGTPFADFIVGTDRTEAIYGGGGADVLRGEGGDDTLDGGAEGDSCAGGASVACEGSEKVVSPRSPSTVAVGLTAPEAGDPAGLYLVGSTETDEVTATYSAEGVRFALASGSLDAASTLEGGCTVPSSAEAFCALSRPPDSLVLAGLEGDDALEAIDFPSVTSIYVLGGDNDDDLKGTQLTEDVLVDGPGSDRSETLGGDDVLLNNEGADTLLGEDGNDLFLSNSLCDGDELDGGGARDNASWSKLDEPVAARLGIDGAGQPDSEGEPSCGGTLDTLIGIEDLEGTDHGDFFYGGAEDAQLLGRNGADTYEGEGGKDRILANDGETDLAIACGGDQGDIALVDFSPPNGPGDPPPSGCERVVERPEDDFRLPVDPEEPPDSEPDSPAEEGAPSSPPPPPAPPPPWLLDRVPPQTWFAHRPGHRVFTVRRWRKVAFVFAANEPSRFVCKLDRRPVRGCGQVRRYWLRTGRHALRVRAIDAAGNRDGSFALHRFVIRRVSARWIRNHRHRARNR